MQFQTITTIFALVASTFANSIEIDNVDTRAGCTPIYKNIVYNCGAASDLLKISSLTISPDSPVRGQNITIHAKGTLAEDVTGGNINVKAKYLFFNFNRDYDLCETAPNAGKQCPFKKGDISFDGSFQVTDSIPGGNYNIDMHATSNNKKTISKLNLKIQVR